MCADLTPRTGTRTAAGISGDLCIPPCDAQGNCPQDKPEGATATPGCILTNSQSGQKFCALVCTPSNDNKVERLFDAQYVVGPLHRLC